MDFQKAKEIFNLLFEGVDGYKLSFESRNQLGFYDRGLTYGEIFFDTFYKMLEKTQPKEGEVFYDLGSGTGKAVFAAYFFFLFQRRLGLRFYLPFIKLLKPFLRNMKESLEQKFWKKRISKKLSLF